ncbi:MAG TPA: formyltransferase [Gemmatimonadaceae bacterium]|nr:formyltransferase [Gemmatimonadaceae bacterium]
MTRAVVFAYHNVGVRCLKVLLAHGVDVSLVVTHADDPRETQWFDSVAATTADYGIATIAPDDPNAPDVRAQVAARAPDFLFSFYYRRMLAAPLLALPARGALNMHGSLLPKFRGRAPVNWAVLAGERETGATLHYMTTKPDSGDIVGQTAVPILPDDTAREVFDKVTVAAEMTLDRALPGLIDGTAPRQPQDVAQGSYFGGRRPEDGVIDWTREVNTIHNLVRAVAPPYPGAFTAIGGVGARILRTRVVESASPPTLAPTLAVHDGKFHAHCGGGGTLHVLSLEIAGAIAGPQAFAARFGSAPVSLGERTDARVEPHP